MSITEARARRAAIIDEIAWLRPPSVRHYEEWRGYLGWIPWAHSAQSAGAARAAELGLPL